MNVKEAAKLIGGCSPSLVYKLMRTKQLEYTQTGRRRLPTEKGVREYIERTTVPAKQPTIQPKTRPAYKEYF